MLCRCASATLLVVGLLAASPQTAVAQVQEQQTANLDGRLLYGVDGQTHRLIRQSLQPDAQVEPIGVVRTTNGKVIDRIDAIAHLPRFPSLFGFWRDSASQQTRLLHIDKQAGHATFVGAPLGAGRVTGACILQLIEGDDGKLVLPTQGAEIPGLPADNVPTPADQIQRMRLFVVQAIDSGVRPTIKTYQPNTVWSIQPRSGLVRYGVLRERAGVAEWKTEGKLTGISGSFRIDAFTFDSQGNLWFFNDDITSRLYRVDLTSFDKDESTPLKAVYIGNTKLRSRDQLTNMRFIGDRLYAIGAESRRIYQIDTDDASSTQLGSLNKPGSFHVGGFAIGADGAVYLTKLEKYGSATGVYRMTHFPTGALEKICELKGSGKVASLTAHPDGRLLAMLNDTWYEIDSAAKSVHVAKASKLGSAPIDFFYMAEHEFIEPPAAQASRLLHVNYTTGETAVLMKLGRSYDSLAVLPDGSFYATSGQELYRIDPLSRRERLVTSLSMKRVTALQYAAGSLWAADVQSGKLMRLSASGHIQPGSVKLGSDMPARLTLVRSADEMDHLVAAVDVD